MADPAAAPAQPDPSDPARAAETAVTSRDQSAYHAARLAERTGTPLPPGPVELPDPDPDPDPDDHEPLVAPTSPQTPPAPAKPVSKRQQVINDYERTIAEQKAELARLKAPAQAPAPPPQAAQPQPTSGTPFSFAKWDTWSEQHPDQSYDDYIDARTDARTAHGITIERQRLHQEASTRDAYQTLERLTAQGRQTYPDFDTKMEAALAAGATFSPLLTGAVLRFPAGHDLAYRLVDAPEALAQLSAITDPVAFALALAPFLSMPAESPAKPSARPLTLAPPPPTTLGSKPAEPADDLEAAVASGDQAAYHAARLRQRIAAHR